MSVEEKVSDITKLILHFYNKNFDKNEENMLTTKNLRKDIDIDKVYNNIFLKKHKPLEEKTKILEINKNNPTKKNISDMNFIRDKKLIEKILKYKLIEINKKITIFKLIYVAYKNNIILLLHKDDELEKGTDNQVSKDNLNILVSYIRDYMFGDKKQLDLLLNDYNNLNNFFNNKLA